MKTYINDFTIEGTPAEIAEMIRIYTGPQNFSGGVTRKVSADPGEKKQEKQAPAKKEVDWAKAAALRKAGWSYDKIGEELGVSGVTVSAHLNKQ